MHWPAWNINSQLDRRTWLEYRRRFQSNQLKNISPFQACLKIGKDPGRLKNLERNHQSFLHRHAQLLRWKAWRNRNSNHGASVERCLNVQGIQDNSIVTYHLENKGTLQRNFRRHAELGQVEKKRVQDFKIF